MRNAGLEETQAGIKIAGRNINNLRDGEAWWAAAYGVAQGRTRLKRLSSSSGGSSLMREELAGSCVSASELQKQALLKS